MKKVGVVVEKVLIKNYFDYFNLDITFDLDTEVLDKRYLEWQSKFHPDVCSTANYQNKQFKQEQSILVNEAYQTLKSPLKRAEYLLSILLKKCDVVKPTQELLLEAMEMREKAKKDDPFLYETYNACVKRIKEAFADNDLLEMACHTMRLKYITKIKEDICN